jgi:hypothetical protein
MVPAKVLGGQGGQEGQEDLVGLVGLVEDLDVTGEVRFPTLIFFFQVHPF